MISYLCGKVIYKSAPSKKGSYIIVDTGGVGYQVLVTLKTFEKIKMGDEAEIHTYLYVREDAMELFGFFTQKEADFFKLLIGISGIGPKSAINILDIADIEDIQNAVIAENPQALTRISSMSKRTAERIVLGLKTSIKNIIESGGSLEGKSGDIEVMEVLVSLGFAPEQARRALAELPLNIKTSEEKTKAALKILGKRR